MLSIKDAFDTTVCTNNWCIPKFKNTVKVTDGSDKIDEVEIGLYKEEDGSLTLQIFYNEDIILCRTVVEEERMENCYA